MQTTSPTPALARILLVSLLVALLGLLPYPARLRQLGQQARDLSAAQPDRAASATREILELQPWRVELWEQAGQLEMQAGNPEAAASALEEARSRAILSEAGWRLLAEAYLQARHSARAVQVWNEYLDRFGPSAEVYARLVDTLRDSGDLAATLAALERWQAFEPGNARPRYLGGLLLLNDQPGQALQLLLAAARLDASLSPAVETLRKAVGMATIAEQPAYGKLVIGRALGSLGEWELARQEFAGAVELAPDYAEAWAFLSEARQNLGQDGHAELEKAVALNPESVTVQALLSVYWRRQGQPQDALAALQKIRRQEPEQIIWQIETGNTLAESGDLVAALPYFQHATQLEPDNPLAWLALANFSVNYDLDISETGLPAARRALLLDPKSADVLGCMGMAFFKLGDLTSAERFLQRALAEDSRLAAAALHLGQVYLHQNRLDQARAPLAAAARLDPDGQSGEIAARLLKTYFPGSQ